MIGKSKIVKGAYFDSVSLMTVGKEVSAMDGVIDAAVVMGTAENRAILSASGLLTSEFDSASDTDLLISVKADDQEIAEAAIVFTETLLEQAGNKHEDNSDYQPKSINSAVDMMPDANLALISVAGRYASAEAMTAINAGLHVMLFSDNISIETYNDHRIAMCFSLFCLKNLNITIQDPNCVNKTYPDYFKDLKSVIE